MWMRKKKHLRYTCILSAQVCDELKKAHDVIFDSTCDTRGCDDDNCLIKTMLSIGECSEKMVTVSSSFAQLYKSVNGRPIKPGEHFRSAGYESEELFFLEDRFLRKAVYQSKLAYETLCDLYEVALEALGSAANRDDNEQLYHNLKTIEECKEMLLTGSSLIAEINECVEKRDLEALYAPPSYFEKR